MITLTPLLFKYKDGFCFLGHAEYAESGQDIVCSAVSAIAQATVNSLDRYTSIQSEVESGKVFVMVERTNVQSDVLIDMMVTAIRTIALQYPQHVEVMEEQHDKN